MQFEWLIKNNSKKLIIFFNGWSMDRNAVSHLYSNEYDVLMFYDYSSIFIPEEIINDCNIYSEINILGWSMGVWASCAILDRLNNVKNVIAINGTLVPVSNSHGIPEKIFKFTLLTLSENTYKNFFKNMFSTPDESEKLVNTASQRNIKDQKEELERIQSIASAENFDKNINMFTKAIVANADKIIPAKNQLEFWGKSSNISLIKLDKSHYIFDLFNKWDEIMHYGE